MSPCPTATACLDQLTNGSVESDFDPLRRSVSVARQGLRLAFTQSVPKSLGAVSITLWNLPKEAALPLATAKDTELSVGFPPIADIDATSITAALFH